MKPQVFVGGLGRFGTAVATELSEQGHDVLAVDKDESKVQEVSGQVTHAAQADITNEAVLRELGVPNFDIAVVGVGSDLQVSLLSTVLLQRMGVPYVTAVAVNELHGLTLERLGAKLVVYPSREAGERLAHRLGYPDVVDYLEVTPDFGVSKITPPPMSVGKTLEEAALAGRGGSGMAVLLILRGSNVILTPDRFERVASGDVLIVAGKDQQLERLEVAVKEDAKLIASP